MKNWLLQGAWAGKKVVQPHTFPQKKKPSFTLKHTSINMQVFVNGKKAGEHKEVIPPLF